jgi:hypothetical protein
MTDTPTRHVPPSQSTIQFSLFSPHLKIDVGWLCNDDKRPQNATTVYSFRLYTFMGYSFQFFDWTPIQSHGGRCVVPFRQAAAHLQL